MLAPSATGEVGYPQGVQDFEAFSPGEDLASVLPNWVIVSDSAPASNFTLEIANDVLSDCQKRCDSSRWLRSTDIDGGNVQNRYYSPAVVSQGEDTYQWSFYVNLETTPPGGANTKPKLTIQHRNAGNAFANAWGIEFADTGASLIVTGIGGAAASTPLYSLSGATGVGQWVKLDLIVNLTTDVVSASANNGEPVSLPINLASPNPNEFRFCYRGEGAGNVQTMLVDDVAVCVGSGCTKEPACTSITECPALGIVGLLGLAGGLLVTGGTISVVRRRKP
jgi:hypothetical protein